MEQAVGAYGRLDYAFNNAGIEIEKGKLADGTLDEFDAIMGVNVKGVWLCMKYQLPLMQAQGGGVIVNTASVAGLGAAPKMSIYAASKHAVIGLTKSAAIEYAKRGIRVNAVCPAVIDTDMFRRAYEADPRKAEFAAAMHPVGRIGKVEEIASAVLYLCSDGAAFTTGHALTVDGGVALFVEGCSSNIKRTRIGGFFYVRPCCEYSRNIRLFLWGKCYRPRLAWLVAMAG